MKLSPKQREALEWLSKEPWTDAWWGGRPHGGWPREMRVQTYNSLSLAGLIATQPTGARLDRRVYITAAGQIALRKALALSADQ